ncbi:MAG: efflux RND transporter permease subunit [Gammaproteobacteria bacterium]|nr:efflux RND transporter permease subunit [Gammaproteobacteria bacterium]
MMNRWIDIALTQRLFVWLILLVLLSLGTFAWLKTPIDAFPNVTSPQVKVILKAPGMTPEEIESRITALVETEMLGIAKQKTLRSMTKYALTDITVTFEDGTDIYWARQQVAERLNGLRDKLPSGLEGGIAPPTTPLSDILMFTLDSPTLSLAERRQLLDWVIRPTLRTIAGVADVNALGGEVRSYEVEPDPQRMVAHGITFAQLQSTLLENNQNDGAGRLVEGEEVLIVRSLGSLTSTQAIAALRINTANHQAITVGDVARVRMGSLTRYGGVTRNGEGETVQGIVLATTGVDTKAVLNEVEKKLISLTPSLPDSLSINIFYHRGQLIDRAIKTISKALLEAIALVLLLLIVFLGNWRAALTVATLLPMALIISFIWLYALGISANLMSLGGLVIALGLIVDNGVVVVENIVHRLQKSPQHRLPKLHLIACAVKEMAIPVGVGMTIIVLIFLPLLSLEDIEGKLFKPVALSIIFTLISALLLALLVIPTIAAQLIKHHHPSQLNWLDRLECAYERGLIRWQAHTLTLLGFASVALVGATFLFGQIGKIFLPTMDEGDLIVQLEKTPSINLIDSLALDSRVQQALLSQVPEIKAIIARAGSDEIGLDPMGLNDTDTFVSLHPAHSWRTPYDKEAVKQAIQRVLEQFPGINTTLTQPIEMRVSEMLTGTRGDIAIKIYGNDSHQLTQLASYVYERLQGMEGVSEVFTPTNDGLQYLNFTLDHEKIRHFSLTVDELQSYLRSQLEGVPAGTVYEANRRTPIVLRGSGVLDESLNDLSLLPIPNSTASGLLLSDLATAQRSESAVSISREQGQRFAVVLVNVAERDLSSVVVDAQHRLADLHLPEGYHLVFGGQFENQQRVNQRLSWIISLGVLFIVLLLVVTLKRWSMTLLALSTIPFALIGGIVSLYLSGEYLSLPASIGFIALLGIATLNGVVMLDTFNRLEQQGISPNQIFVQGAKRRLRPVLMTASIAALGLVPLLFATGPGSEIQRPLAIVIIGGLVTSTLITLVLLPLLYQRFVSKKHDNTTTI